MLYETESDAHICLNKEKCKILIKSNQFLVQRLFKHFKCVPAEVRSNTFGTAESRQVKVFPIVKPEVDQLIF